jgi:hypothetical protein
VKENPAKVNQAGSIEELKGLFKTIVIDPPRDWGDEEDVNQMGRAKPDYATIPYEDLLKYPDSTEKLWKLRKLLFCNVSSIVFHI